MVRVVEYHAQRNLVLRLGYAGLAAPVQIECLASVRRRKLRHAVWHLCLCPRNGFGRVSVDERNSVCQESGCVRALQAERQVRVDEDFACGVKDDLLIRLATLNQCIRPSIVTLAVFAEHLVGRGVAAWCGENVERSGCAVPGRVVHANVHKLTSVAWYGIVANAKFVL